MSEIDRITNAARSYLKDAPFQLVLPEARRPTPADRLRQARVWLALKLIGKTPVVLNVEVGDCDGYAVRAFGGLISNAVVRPSDQIKGCIHTVPIDIRRKQ